MYHLCFYGTMVIIYDAGYRRFSVSGIDSLSMCQMEGRCWMMGILTGGVAIVIIAVIVVVAAVTAVVAGVKDTLKDEGMDV